MFVPMNAAGVTSPLRGAPRTGSTPCTHVPSALRSSCDLKKAQADDAADAAPMKTAMKAMKASDESAVQGKGKRGSDAQDVSLWQFLINFQMGTWENNTALRKPVFFHHCWCQAAESRECRLLLDSD